MKTNIFDLTQLDDLPEEVRDHLVNKKLYGQTKQVYELFGEGRYSPLSFDELIVGFYRRYNKELTRSGLSAILHKLIHKYKFVTPLGEGRNRVYEYNTGE